MRDPDACPDCGEPIAVRRGIVPLTGTLYCPSCNWCEVIDRGRGKDAVEDWVNRNVRNHQGGDDEGEAESPATGTDP